MKEMKRYIQGLAPELQERLMACEDTEAAFRLAREEGLELPEEALDAVYGGCTSYTYVRDDYYKCNTCKSRVQLKSVGHDGFPNVYYCGTCFTTRGSNEVFPWTDILRKEK